MILLSTYILAPVNYATKYKCSDTTILGDVGKYASDLVIPRTLCYVDPIFFYIVCVFAK
jgi:hypothetical protein